MGCFRVLVQQRLTCEINEFYQPHHVSKETACTKVAFLSWALKHPESLALGIFRILQQST